MWAWVLVLSAWGGVVRNIRKIKDGEIPGFTFIELVYDIIVSGFVGVLTFLLCQYAGVDSVLSAILIGVSSHMGARALAPFEQAFGVWVRTLVNKG